MKAFLAKFFHGIFFIICVDLAATGLWGWGATHYFERHPPSKAPIAAVLMADYNETMEDLGAETQRRLNHARALYDAGQVEYILCAGGARPGLNMFGSESMRRFLINAGIPEEKVFLERKSYDSKTNWAMIRQIVANYGWSKVVIVSSPFHLYRFRQIVREGPPHSLEVFFSPYPFKGAKPPMTYFDMWAQVHYQWAAHYAQLLPEDIYKKLVYRMRAQ
ncbi:MAG TPA: YdcF family protein [Candidatus Omnitrophota bacterium]|nr:YdcF family protein [Candidatus Omnitrophota bacterium]